MFFTSMFGPMRVNLHNESKQLINSMATPKVPQPRSSRSCTSILEESHEALTLAELRRVFLREATAQEVFVDLVGEYLDDVIKSNDLCQV
jgi:hypothetical protein